MTPKVPTIESGTAMDGMMVAAIDRRKRKITMTTRAMVSSKLELYILHRGADGIGAVGEYLQRDVGRQRTAQLRQQLLYFVDNANDVRARLSLDVDDDRGLQHEVAGGCVFCCGLRGETHPRCKVEVLRRVSRVGDITQANGIPISVSNDDVAIVNAREQLIVGADGVRLTCAIQVSLGLIDVGGAERGTHVLQAEAVVRHGRGVRLNTHRRLLAAIDRDQANARKL